MEMHQIICDNLGMTRDTSISSLSKGEDGSTNYAFENHNIRILAVNDNTKFSVTNEKSTKYEGNIIGTFIGGCTCGRYLVLFMHIANELDAIYRLEYTGENVQKVLLYQGNLQFALDHPIEAIGYYESEEVQKVYWVDGLNKNRMINIVDANRNTYTISTDANNTTLYYKSSKNLEMTDGTLYALCKKDGTLVAYAKGLNFFDKIWFPANIGSRTSIASLPDMSAFINNVKSSYNEYSFDFQGNIDFVPKVKITKNYSTAGTFQAGVLQYFITYYNKYGVETCLVWNSDLQYISLLDRGAKPDEAVSCAFDFEITNLEEKYDYLRIYAAYRSGINGVVSARVVADINLSTYSHDDTLKFTDLGSEGINFNAADIPYIGGQDIRANTLDYKQDTMFFGDIYTPDTAEDTVYEIPKQDVVIDWTHGYAEKESFTIKEGCTDGGFPLLSWAYKYVSPIATEGIYSYTPEIRESQEDVAGFKYREVYRFGIQFMDADGAWTSPSWLGDKYCSLPPRTFTEETDININKAHRDDILSSKLGTEIYIEEEHYDKETLEVLSQPEYSQIPQNERTNNYGLRILPFIYNKQDGCYIATIVFDQSQLADVIPNISKYKAYRLLVANSDATNRRIVTQGVINPTMFNYVDRSYNRPYSIPSWIFRPRLSDITNRHYDTLPIQTAPNAELQGIMEKKVPGFAASSSNVGKYDSYMFIVAANEASIWSGFIQWKLIYYNSGMEEDGGDQKRAELLKIAMFTAIKKVNEQDPSDERTRYLEQQNTADDVEIEEMANLLKQYQCYLKQYNSNVADTAPGGTIVSCADLTLQQIKDYIAPGNAEGGQAPYYPVHVYGKDYKIISSHIYDNSRASGTTTPSKWTTLRSKLVTKITDDMQNTTTEDVGEELKGRIVLSAAMLPDEDTIKLLAGYDDTSSEEISMAIMAALVAAAAVVISALSFGTATGGAAIVANLAIAAAVSVCAASAVGMASAAAYMDITRITNPLAKKMMSMGYYSLYNKSSSLGERRARSRTIGLFLEKYFKPEGYIYNNENAQDWYVPVLYGESGAVYNNDFSDDEGNVPFTTKHPYTEKGRIGEDYNAYVTTGRLSTLTQKEKDLKQKQNLYCVDESIVTLNAPDIEDVYAMIDNSESLQLDLVGMIPVDATYGMYHLMVESGLNTNSQVIQSRFVQSAINAPLVNTMGMLNGYIYQGFRPAAESQFLKPDNESSPLPIQVTESIAAYRLFMWNKHIAEFWFPGITLTSPMDDEEVIMEPKGKILNKIFANMRYSTHSLFYPPVTMGIESPVTSVSSDVTLKTFRYKSDSKNYYENVDTISVNNDAYSLVENGVNFPVDATAIENGALKDPVHIRYKETPHVLIPFKNGDSVDSNSLVSRILPYTSQENFVTPLSLYGKDTLGSVQLEGISNTATYVLNKYVYVVTLESGGQYASWGITGPLLPTSINKFAEVTGITLDTLLHISGAGQLIVGGMRVDDWNKAILLFDRANNKYYKIRYSKAIDGTIGYYSSEVTTIEENAEIIVSNQSYYVTKNIVSVTIYEESTSYTISEGYASLVGVTDVLTLCSDYPKMGTWSQQQLSWRAPSDTPYLFMGELIKKNFDYNTWNGGTSEKAMQQLVWNVASHVTPIDESINKSWGDTYYQRWDCEKTYPFTEEDVNSNVEVLSFMLESHKNLDGRCDTNRGIHNLVNVRPSNTIFNNVYSQEDNFFTYQILDEKFNKEHFGADIVWSLTKNNLDDIDKWTCLIASNEMSLDGRYGPVRKIINVNDVLVAFQDTGIAQIKYNETAALNTTAGLPIQMGNTGKVDGYRMISDTTGCHNKFSINKNSAGVFFADDFNKSFNQFTVNSGMADISMRANFSNWFRKNLNGHIWDAANRDNFRTSYDEVTHDLYIIRGGSDESTQKCLVYNTLLQKFTSFMDYVDTPMIAHLISNNGDTGTFAIRNNTAEINGSIRDIIEIWKMFGGDDYGYIYGNFAPYSMEYRLNPDPLHDSIFTNYQYAADWLDPTQEVDEDNIFDTPARRYTTFDTVEAKNEYQKGILNIQQSGNIASATVEGKRRVFGNRDVKSMFRLWRGFIPRDKDGVSGAMMKDRMRNPWIHLKFEKSTPDDSKMVFHNLMVNYYNQYGRF